MSRRRAQTQADVARAIRAAMQECADGWVLEFLVDGTIRITRSGNEERTPKAAPVPPRD